MGEHLEEEKGTSYTGRNMVMRKGKPTMDNSILPILPAIHATILSIIFAVLIVFFFYSYQTVSNLKEQMNDLRTKTAQNMIHLPYFRPGAKEFNVEDYFKDNTLNLSSINQKLSEISSVMMSLEISKAIPIPHPSMGEDYIEETLVENAKHFVEIVNLLANISPYCEKITIEGKNIKFFGGAKRIKYDRKWQRDLISLNGFLFWLWRTKGEDIRKLMSEYDAISAKKNSKQRFGFTFSQFVSDFFTQVQFIETKIIPELREKSYKLNFYEQKFKIKTHLVLAFSVAIPMLVLGIFLPLFIHLYIKPPNIKLIELGLLIITVLPYLCILLYYLKKTLELKFR
ncbi:MAG: hypothetical protein FVQ84_09930 [Planctomycetes bacterium]|nr:hypothetical protein [Planctomycetota bacterium]